MCCWVDAYTEYDDGRIMCASCQHWTQLSYDAPTPEQLAAVADADGDGEVTEEEEQSWATRAWNFLTGK